MIARNKSTTLILCSLIFVLICAIGACQRATPPTTSVSTSTAGVIQRTTETTSSGTSFPPIILTTTPKATSSTGGPYPAPGTPISTAETELPYPRPSIPAASSPTITPIANATLPPTATITQPPTEPPQPSATQQIEQATATATNTEIPPTPDETEAYPGPEVTDTPPYPGPEESETPSYPGPEETDTPPPIPGSATITIQVTSTPVRTFAPTRTRVGTQPPLASPTRVLGTPGQTPTELPPRPPLSPPPAGSSVTIWHSWNTAETEMLQSVIRSFQRLYPDVIFNLLYIPQDDLFDNFQAAVYLGQGPDLLLGPTKWGPALYEKALITLLGTYIPANYLMNINKAAIISSNYQGSLISLPLSLHGLLMFRNASVISTPPISFEQLSTLSHEVTYGGVVGSYLDRGSYFSAASIVGLGGEVISSNGRPSFNSSFGLEWLDLLTAYDDAGAITFNTNRDLEMFKRGRVAIIIDGSWNIAILAETIGLDNLVIDPWPTYGSGHMAGWVESDGAFLNINTTGNDRFAALSFMGYLLDPNVQLRLAEVGHIPSVLDTQPRDRLIKQAMLAFSTGAAYPNMVDDAILAVYWSELDTMIKNMFEKGTDPASALKVASDNITQKIRILQMEP